MDGLTIRTLVHGPEIIFIVMMCMGDSKVERVLSLNLPISCIKC